MAKENRKKHRHIAYFNPDVMSLEQSHQDFSSEMKLFNAGQGYENFNDFMSEEAVAYKDAGDGVTYVVWNVKYDKNNKEIGREVVSYYTLAATAIPFSLLNKVIGFKALFLHSLPEAEKFYMANGFNPVEINMQPLHCIDSEYKAMYLALKEVHMNYDG